MASIHNIHPSTSIKAQTHWNLRAGLARRIEDAVKEILWNVVDPIVDHIERLLMSEENLIICYNSANLFNPSRTQADLKEWFPNDGDWDLFFLVLDLLRSTSRYRADEDTPICFAGFTLQDAITLLSLDFKPHPKSYCASSIWDNQKKQLAIHLATKMDQMRKAQGYSSLILGCRQHSTSLKPLGPTEQ
ncbi:hypothetical protein Pst134EA_022464 [Puccinia striiformis f. sp. tritici]|uniref:hypothetical protein n=1 Tax=Puccinia striiformis f. sp. tritici TaxID=168172 RepID=UPI0020089CB8|nr:hypothetical protein Pst134EA_022464 [Puccinia striiformis f. sp. tritici]KAH9454976.1 hypothetical protein Pst134EA_022464 [Puccinia striiformis f. sp. tritici]KAI9621566.1 hypothetical protein H4Q26_015572 [Puccinia striiformis f. sp. tritici PST-130]